MVLYPESREKKAKEANANAVRKWEEIFTMIMIYDTRLSILEKAETLLIIPIHVIY